MKDSEIMSLVKILLNLKLLDVLMRVYIQDINIIEM